MRSKYEKQDLNIGCEVIDFSALKELYVQSLSLQEVIPEKVKLHLPEGRFFERKNHILQLLRLLRAIALINLFKSIKSLCLHTISEDIWVLVVLSIKK